MENSKPKKTEYKVSDKVLKIVEEHIHYPSIIETDFYLYDALNIIIEKNKLIWSIKKFDGYSQNMIEGLIKFNDSDIYLSFVKRVDDNTYKFFVLFPEHLNDSVLFMLNTLKKYKTI